MSRRRLLDRLLTRLRPQLTDRVSVLTLMDSGQAAVGAKRQKLIEAARADYVSFVDDDDLVPWEYVRWILDVLDSDDPPDVVGFRLRHFVYGTVAGVGVHSYDAANIPTPGMQRGWQRHDREPNHLNPVRRELALKAGYRPLHYGEDGDYARRLAKLKPRETFIDAELYWYLDVPNKVYEHWKRK